MTSRRQYEEEKTRFYEEEERKVMAELVGICEICDAEGITQDAVGIFITDEGVSVAMCEAHRKIHGEEDC